MKTLQTIAGICMLSSLFLVTSCQNEEVESQNEITNTTEIPAEILEKIASMSLNPSDVVLRSIEDIDGTTENMYEIEGDILISESQLLNTKIDDGVGSKQYRTFNLVSTPRTIRVVGYTGTQTQFVLNEAARRGLQFAVDNYNQLNMNLRMELVFSGGFTDDDILVFTQTNGATIAQDGIRGQAGFPENGQPFKRVIINGGANNSGNDQILEGLFTHELGHCVGLRHTDWDTRRSCGQSGEAAGAIGAVYIPGTPGASDDPNSIMQACFPGARNQGEFGEFDRVALETIY